MDWTGAALVKNCGYALQGILVTVAMETGIEELELWKSPSSLSLLNLG